MISYLSTTIIGLSLFDKTLAKKYVSDQIVIKDQDKLSVLNILRSKLATGTYYNKNTPQRNFKGKIGDDIFLIQSMYELGTYNTKFNYAISGRVQLDEKGVIIQYRTLIHNFTLKYIALLITCSIVFLIGILSMKTNTIIISLVLYLIADLLFNIITIQNSTEAKVRFKKIFLVD